MAPVDAMWLWLAAKFGTDQFIAYAFAGVPVSVPDAVATLLGRAERTLDLTLRVRDDPIGLRYPLWVPGAVHPGQVRVHSLTDATWAGVLDALANLVHDQIDPHLHAWRVHVFSPVSGVPGSQGDATVVVVQMPHALGDGLRAAALAGVLLGREGGPAAVAAAPPEGLLRRGLHAVHERRALARDTAAGRVPEARQEVPALSTNAAPTAHRVLRTVVRCVDELPGPTPTIGALVAISDALAGYLRARGEDASQLTAGVPIARSGAAQAFNHIDTALVGLYPDVPRSARIPRIAADIVESRRRIEHAAFAAKERAFAAIPAVVRHWGITRTDFAAAAATVPGNTVVSSVDRGPADLQFGGCRVLFTAGYPVLLPICNLAHGVHVLGETVAISVHTTTAIAADEYAERLAAALG